MALTKPFLFPSLRSERMERLIVIFSVFLAVSVEGRRLTADTPPAVSCPASAVEKCDFYFEGYRDTPPVISLDGTPDTGVGPRLIDSQTGETVQVGNTGDGSVVCNRKSGLTTTANQFYANGQEAQIHIRTFNQPPRESFENLCILLPLLAVQTNSLNLNPNDNNQATYPDSHRCVLFSTGPSGTCSGSVQGPSSPPLTPPTISPVSSPPPSLFPPSQYTISPPPVVSPPMLDAFPPPSFKPPPPGKPLFPAIFAFGDSILDVGNNNNISSSLRPPKVNFLPYGIDYIPASGRFSNGKGFLDYLAELSSLAPVLKFLDLNSTNFDDFASGVNFASGGSGTFPAGCEENTLCTDFGTQVARFTNLSTQYSKETLGKSLIIICTGGNDYFAYFRNATAYNVTEYINDVITAVSQGIQSIYRAGGRKFLLFEVGGIGCTPVTLATNNVSTLNPVCVPSASLLASSHNAALRYLVSKLGPILQDAHFVFAETEKFVQDASRNPSAFGFVDGSSACCGGGGPFNVGIRCGAPGSSYCSNRDDYLFWDGLHFSQQAMKLVSEGLFTGNPSYVTPFGVEALSAY